MVLHHRSLWIHGSFQHHWLEPCAIVNAKSENLCTKTSQRALTSRTGENPLSSTGDQYCLRQVVFVLQRPPSLGCHLCCPSQPSGFPKISAKKACMQLDLQLETTKSFKTRNPGWRLWSDLIFNAVVGCFSYVFSLFRQFKQQRRLLFLQHDLRHTDWCKFPGLLKSYFLFLKCDC